MATGPAPEKYAFVINPHSSNGNALKSWKQFESRITEILPDYTLFLTEYPEHASELTRQALHDGFDRVVSVGGDGTHYEVTNGFFENGSLINPEASMTILPIGTACDFRKTIDLPLPKKSIDYLTSPDTDLMDVGKVTNIDGAGVECIRYFNTSAHIGFGGLVCEIVNRRSKVMGGFMTFLSGVITARFTYKCPEISITIDDEESIVGPKLEVIAGNGIYDGGGMKAAPHARMDDGLLEIYVMDRMGIYETLSNVIHMYRGTQDSHSKVFYARGRKVRIESEERVIVSPDGEVSGILPATVEVVSKAIPMVVGENAPID
jgi:YegS/Rv2252/BmrU family lipid kinase